MTVFGVILAGGTGRRLGSVNKSTLRIGSKTLLTRLLDTLEPQLDKVAISGSVQSQERSLRTDLPLLFDQFDPQIGPLGGIDAGYRWAKSIGASDATDLLLIAPVDTPHFPANFVEMVQERIRGQDVVVAKFNEHNYPTCSLWRLGAAANIAPTRKDAANNSIRAYLDKLNVAYLDFADSSTANPFKNANKISDLISFDTRVS